MCTINHFLKCILPLFNYDRNLIYKLKLILTFQYNLSVYLASLGFDVRTASFSFLFCVITYLFDETIANDFNMKCYIFLMRIVQKFFHKESFESFFITMYNVAS